MPSMTGLFCSPMGTPLPLPCQGTGVSTVRVDTPDRRGVQGVTALSILCQLSPPPCRALCLGAAECWGCQPQGRRGLLPNLSAQS